MKQNVLTQRHRGDSEEPLEEGIMEAGYEELIEFLNGLSTDNVSHTEGTLLGHLIAVYRDLKAWGCDESLCRAGMFHSIYGTEKFQKFTLPLARRDDVRRLIGERAERLAYLNCVMDRASFDKAASRTRARIASWTA